MVGWHHQLDEREFEQALGVGDRQGSLACCSPWGRKEADTTEQLNFLSDLMISSSCPLIHTPARDTKGDRGRQAPALQDVPCRLYTSLLLASHWPELDHMATPVCKGVWESHCWLSTHIAS